ncbi:MAG: hypothetical protein HY584_00510, partial [Candidatus Omnitrophica bacterium]|nr:hypothetical protein [Candidatus Omnitrophota bacterium]
MRIEKKLKQGLADLSRLLSAHYEFSLKARQKTLLTIESPIEATLYRSPPRLVTAAFSTPDHEIKGDFDFIRLANSLKTAFQKVVILSLVSSPLGNGRWAMRN